MARAPWLWARADDDAEAHAEARAVALCFMTVWVSMGTDASSVTAREGHQPAVGSLADGRVHLVRCSVLVPLFQLVRDMQLVRVRWFHTSAGSSLGAGLNAAGFPVQMGLQLALVQLSHVNC